MALGKVLGENKLIFRVAAGTATDDEGKEYELSNSLSGAPVIQLPNGRIILFEWKDLINDAIEALEKEEHQ